MALPRHRGPQHLIEGQFDAVVRVQTGAEIGQTAGGVGQHGVALAIEHRRQGGQQGRDPAVQGAGEGRRNALTRAQRGAAGQQRIGGGDFGLERLVQQALADAPCRQDDAFQFQPFDQTLEDERGVGQGLGALLRQAGPFLERGLRRSRDQPGGVQHLAGVHFKLMHDPQRIAADGHMHLRQRPPGAADGVEGVGLEVSRRLEPVGDGLALAVGVEAARIGQGEGAEGEGGAAPDLALGQPHQLEAGTAQIADHAISVGNAREDAEGGVTRLFLAGQDADPETGFGGDAVAEVPAVFRLAHGGRGGDEGVGGLDALDHGGEAFEGRQGLGGALDRQSARRGQIAAEAGQHLLVEHRPDGAAFQPVQHQTHRVGADVDGGDVTRRADHGLQRVGHQRFFRDGS